MDFFQYVIAAGGHDWTGGYGFRSDVRLYDVALNSWYFEKLYFLNSFFQNVDYLTCRKIAADMPARIDRGKMVVADSRSVIFLISSL